MVNALSDCAHNGRAPAASTVAHLPPYNTLHASYLGRRNRAGQFALGTLASVRIHIRLLPALIHVATCRKLRPRKRRSGRRANP